MTKIKILQIQNGGWPP